MSPATLPPGSLGVEAKEALAMDLFGQHALATDEEPLPDSMLVARRWSQLSAKARQRWMRVGAFAAAVVTASHAPPAPPPAVH